MALRVRTVLAGRTESRIVDFPGTVADIRIGRRQDLELPLPFQALSTVHARLARDADGRWTVEDLGSRNGTTVDGTRLVVGERRVLAAGNRIGLGVVDVIFDGPMTEALPASSAGPAGTKAEGTGTIARRLVNDLFGGDPGAGAPTLTVLAGAPAATLRLEALDRRYIVGRVEGAALQLVADEVSREHVAFTRTWEGVTVEDLGSKNGIRVNGTRATAQRLHDGDVVELGPIAVRVADPAERYLRELEAQAEAEAKPKAPAESAPPPADPQPAAAPQGDAPAITGRPIRGSRGTRTAILAAGAVLLAISVIALALALGN